MLDVYAVSPAPSLASLVRHVLQVSDSTTSPHAAFDVTFALYRP